MNVNIPEKYREEFDRSADFAVEKEKFTPSELAEHLGKGVLVASIMVGYMEKAGLVTKGKSDDVRRARITLEEWESIGRNIERYEPVPEPEPEVFVAETVDSTELTVSDIIPEEMTFIKKTLSAEDGFIVLCDRESKIAISLEDISVIFLRKGSLFKKGYISFSANGEKPTDPKLSADTLLFKKKDYDSVKELAERVAERLGTEVINI